jgi:hypothetical protein
MLTFHAAVARKTVKDIQWVEMENALSREETQGNDYLAAYSTRRKERSLEVGKGRFCDLR